MNDKATQLGVLVLVASVVLVAGCTDLGAVDNGDFRLLVSDEEADIDDFESLNVTIDEVRIEPANETQEPIVETLDEPRTVDLTAVKGDKAEEIVRSTVPAGSYDKVELSVVDKFDSPGAVRKTPGRVKQSVVDSEEGAKQFVEQQDVQVMVPSGKLQIEKEFTVSPNSTVSFVFDMQVVLKGATSEYNLQPNIGESGVEGEDVPEQEEDEEEEEEEEEAEEEDETEELEEYEMNITTATEGGTTNPEPGTYTYEEEEEVAVEAIPVPGYEFQGWEREGSADDCDQYEETCEFEIEEDSSLAAHFTEEQTEEYILEITTYTDGGAVDPDYGNHTYEEGDEVTVEATPDSGYEFQGWEREGSATECDQYEETCTFTIQEDSFLASHFAEEELENYTLEIVTYTDNGTTEPEYGNHTYEEGEEVTAEAFPDSGYEFWMWEREGSATECDQYQETCTFTMGEDSLLAAHFQPIEYELSIGSTEGGTTQPESGDYTYEEGEEVTAEAINDTGYEFQNWIGNGSASVCVQYNGTCNFTITEDSSLLANFTQTVELQ